MPTTTCGPRPDAACPHQKISFRLFATSRRLPRSPVWVFGRCRACGARACAADYRPPRALTAFAGR